MCLVLVFFVASSSIVTAVAAATVGRGMCILGLVGREETQRPGGEARTAPEREQGEPFAREIEFAGHSPGGERVLGVDVPVDGFEISDR